MENLEIHNCTKQKRNMLLFVLNKATNSANNSNVFSITGHYHIFWTRPKYVVMAGFLEATVSPTTRSFGKGALYSFLKYLSVKYLINTRLFIIPLVLQSFTMPKNANLTQATIQVLLQQTGLSH